MKGRHVRGVDGKEGRWIGRLVLQKRCKYLDKTEIEVEFQQKVNYSQVIIKKKGENKRKTNNKSK